MPVPISLRRVPEMADRSMGGGDRCCRTCRYWDVHSLDMRKGDCRAPSDHRYWHIQFGANASKNVAGTYALLDSFGREETRPDYSCGAWRKGQSEGPLDISEDRA